MRNIFTTNNNLSIPKPINFTIKIDEDGCLRILANNEYLLFIDNETGKLKAQTQDSGCRKKLEGLAFDNKGFLIMETH